MSEQERSEVQCAEAAVPGEGAMPGEGTAPVEGAVPGEGAVSEEGAEPEGGAAASVPAAEGAEVVASDEPAPEAPAICPDDLFSDDDEEDFVVAPAPSAAAPVPAPSVAAAEPAPESAAAEISGSEEPGHEHGEGCECGCEEVFELDVDEDDILYYLEDEDGKRIGFAVLEDGEEVEYLYAEDDDNDEFETVELEFDEDDIDCYLEDDEGNIVGFVMIEDGKEVEYYYEEEDIVPAAERAKSSKDDEVGLGLTRENVADATRDLNKLYKEGRDISNEFKEVFDDINSGFEFLKPAKKGRRRH